MQIRTVRISVQALPSFNRSANIFSTSRKSCGQMFRFSVAHSFRGDYVRIRQNPRWRRVAAETGDEYVVFADTASKVHRTSGKVSSVLLVISTSGILILDHRTLILKHRAPVVDVDKISMSPYNDPIAVFHMKNSQLSRKQGDPMSKNR